MGVPPNYVAKLVGHSIKTMERHYENIQLKNLEPELVEVRKKKLEQADFQTYDLELGWSSGLEVVEESPLEIVLSRVFFHLLNLSKNFLMKLCRHNYNQLLFIHSNFNVISSE